MMAPTIHHGLSAGPAVIQGGLHESLARHLRNWRGAWSRQLARQREARVRRELERQLLTFDDHLLRDIGLGRLEILHLRASGRMPSD